MNQQKGFTLIELIIVIVVLGILAVTAAPRFFDFSKDARIATLQGMQAAVRSAVDMVHMRTLLGGEYDADGKLLVGGEAITLQHGYPGLSAVSLRAVVIADASTPSSDWQFSGNNSDIYIRHTKFNPDVSGAVPTKACYVKYTPPVHSGDGPKISIEVAQC